MEHIAGQLLPLICNLMVDSHGPTTIRRGGRQFKDDPDMLNPDWDTGLVSPTRSCGRYGRISTLLERYSTPIATGGRPAISPPPGEQCLVLKGLRRA